MTTVIDCRNEFKNVSLGDKRLNERLNILIEKLDKHPERSLLRAMGGKKEAEPMYQFLQNRRVDMEIIRDEHKAMTVERIKELGCSLILAPQDTCGINYSGHKKTVGMGFFTDTTLGVNIHTSIGLTTTGIPLGVLAQDYISRDPNAEKVGDSRSKKPIEEKESFRWLTTMDEAEKGIPDNVKVLHIQDREGDMFELFEKAVTEDKLVMSRIVQNRITADNKKIMDNINTLKPQIRHTVQVPRKSNGVVNIPQRETELDITYTKYELKKPRGIVSTKSLQETIEVTVILAREVNPPEGEEPIEWYLLTNMEINNVKDAITMVKYYTFRWRIECMHKALKSNACNVEKLQHRSLDVQLKMLYFYTIIALKMLTITHLSRVAPETTCDVVFYKDEWQLLYRVANNTRDTPEQPYTIKEVVLYLSAIVGYKRRKSDGMPGPKIICEGLTLLSDYYDKMQYISS